MPTEYFMVRVLRWPRRPSTCHTVDRTDLPPWQHPTDSPRGKVTTICITLICMVSGTTKRQPLKAMNNTHSLHIPHTQERVRKSLPHVLHPTPLFQIPSVLILSSGACTLPPELLLALSAGTSSLKNYPPSLHYPHGKKNLGISPYGKINSRWLVHINTNDKIIKHLEGDLGEHLKFLKGRTTKKRMMNWTILKIRMSTKWYQ